MRPDKIRLFRMADLHAQTACDKVAELLDKELETGDDPHTICRRLYLRAGALLCFGDGLKQRIVLLLAVDTLLAFAPETAQQLEAAEAMLERPIDTELS